MSNNRYDVILPTEHSVGNQAKLIYVTSAKYGSDWQSILHTHYCSELFYVVEGKGQFQIEDKLFPVSVNDLVIINPNVQHTETSLGATPLKYIALGVEGLELKSPDTDDAIESNFCIVNFKNIRDTILFYLQHMLVEIRQKSPGYEIVCQDCMEILVVLLSRQTNFSTTLVPVDKNVSRLCSTVMRYINSHYKENLTLVSLAEMAHVSKYHMVHAFTKEYGISPINYMISKRVEEACTLLETTDYSLTVISRILGFSSPSYFSQAFKREKNCSPLKWRKEIHNRK